MGRLTTHVLDTAHGTPAEGVPIRLFKHDEKSALLKSIVTNADGRTDDPLMEGSDFSPGIYELVFSVGDYFSRRGDIASSEEAFLDDVVIRFQITQDEHYHVPLLVSPWSYSTYRGS